MKYKQVIAVTIALTVSAFTGSNVMAHGGGGGHGGGGFGGGGFRGGGFNGGGFRGGGFHGGFPVVVFVVDFVAVVFAVLAFEEASAGIGSAIETLTIGSFSLAILGIHSFTILTLTTDTIPMAIIHTVTDTALTMNLFTKAALDMPTL
jgi:uncharacterized membrane protein